MEPLESAEVLTIEWQMMDKSRFVALSMVNSFSLRCLIYPLTVVKTRLQVQSAYNYTGTSDALMKIIKFEGWRSLYKGFWINSMQVISGIGYLITYEKVRDVLGKRGITDSRVKGLIGGGVSSLVGQTLITPFDVVSQHIMVLGRNGINPLNIPPSELKSRLKIFKRICSEVYKRDGPVGFYRGYFASLIAYVPGSAFWWAFYPVYQDALLTVTPSWAPLIMVQCLAGPLSGLTTCIITNPADIVRARIQVQRLNSWTCAVGHVWH